MNKRSFFAICAACLAVGVWYLRAAAPEQRLDSAMRALRANDAEGVQYQLLTVEKSAALSAQASLLRGWLLLQSDATKDPAQTQLLLTELNDAVTDGQGADRALALALMGRVRYEKKELTEALFLLDQSLRLDPDEVEAHRWAGIVMYDLGLSMGAIPHLEDVARREPHNGRPHRLLGIIHRERGTMIGDAFAFESAIEAYQESLKRDPNQLYDEEIRVDLGRCFLFRNEWDKALDAVRPCSDTLNTLTLRAECYHAKGELDRAMDCIDLALGQYPANPAALSVKATLCLAKRDSRQAATLLERAAEEQPKDYNLRYRLVQVYNHLGEKEKANRHAAEMERLLDLMEEQKTLMRQALTDTDASIRYRLADLSEALDDRQMAETWRAAARMLDSQQLQEMLAAAPAGEGS